MEIETPDYLSYKAYKKMQEQKKKKQTKKLIFLFLTTFFVLLFIFAVIAQQISPHIDLPEDMQQKSNSDQQDVSQDDYKGRVDNRLKDIESAEDQPRTTIQYQTTGQQGQQQNMSISDQIRNNFSNGSSQNGAQQSTQDNYNENGEVRTDLIQKANTNLEKQRSQMSGSRNNPMTPPNIPPRMKTMPKASTPAAAPSAPVPNSINLRKKINSDDTSYAAPKTLKVIVGSYSSPSEAKAASEKLSQSNSRINPFIKEINGQYALQVGSYSDEKKATEIATRLRSQSYSVKVVK